MKFQGWADQRENNFLRGGSETIRRVKLALVAAGVDMPEPIYRVQLSQPATANVAAPLRDHSTAEATDTSAISDISNQIEAEQSQHADSNLLDANAPRE